MAIDWQLFIFDPQNDWIGKMERRARKRFNDENIADEALNYALQKLSEDNWKKLQAFQGRSEPGTFLYSALNNQLEDFARKKFGYLRPPAWIERLGSHWKTLWKRLCLEREQPQVLEIIYAEQPETPAIIKTIKAKVKDCGKYTAITSIGGTANQLEDDRDFDLDEQLNKYSEADSGATPCTETLQQQQQCEQLLAALCQVLGFEAESIDSNALSTQLEQTQFDFSKKLKLDAQQLHILKLRYQHHHTIARISQIMDIKEHQVRRILKKSEQQLLQVLRDCGFDLRDFIHQTA